MISHTRNIQLGDVSFEIVDWCESCWVDGERLSFWDSFEAGTYDPLLLGLIDKYVKPGSAFVDVGSWVGAFSLYAAARGAIALAIEPDPIAFAALQENALLQTNGPSEIHLFPFALSYDDQPLSMLAYQFGQGVTKVGPGEGLSVPSGTLERFLFTAGVEPSQVSLVKIDVEGFELELLPTLAPWLAKRKIPLIVSLHGKMPAKEWFSGFTTLFWPADDPHGDIVALPWPRFGI